MLCARAGAHRFTYARPCTQTHTHMMTKRPSICAEITTSMCCVPAVRPVRLYIRYILARYHSPPTVCESGYTSRHSFPPIHSAHMCPLASRSQARLPDCVCVCSLTSPTYFSTPSRPCALAVPLNRHRQQLCTMTRIVWDSARARQSRAMNAASSSPYDPTTCRSGVTSL